MKDKNGTTALMIASKNGHIETASLLFQNQADVNAQNNNGNSSLIMACREGHTETALLLIDSGADASVVNVKGDSALTVATKANLVPVVRLRLGEHELPGENSPLTIAASNGYTEVAEMLLKAGAKVNLSDFAKYSSFHLPPETTSLGKVNSFTGCALDNTIIQGNPLFL